MWNQVGPGRLASLSLYALANSYLWNSLHPLVLPFLLLTLVPEEVKGTALGGLTFVGLALAMFLQPITGTMSDRASWRWGRRRPFVLIGGLGICFVLSFMAPAPSFVWLLVGYLGLQVVGNVAQGAYQGFLPDLVPSAKRGAAAGAKNAAEVLGIVIASVLTAALLTRVSPLSAFAGIGLVVLLGTVGTMALLPEQAVTQARDEFSLSEVFRVDLRRHAGFAWLVGSRFFTIVAITSVQTFALFFIRDLIGVSDLEATVMTGSLITTIGVAILVVAYPVGVAADRWGRKPFLFFAGGLGALGALLMLAATSYLHLVLFGSLLGISTGIFLTTSWALFTDLVPDAEAARFLGLSNLATAGGAAAARLHGPLIDALNGVGHNLGYRALLVLLALWFVLGAALLVKVREQRPAQVARPTLSPSP